MPQWRRQCTCMNENSYEHKTGGNTSVFISSNKACWSSARRASASLSSAWAPCNCSMLKTVSPTCTPILSSTFLCYATQESFQNLRSLLLCLLLRCFSCTAVAFASSSSAENPTRSISSGGAPSMAMATALGWSFAISAGVGAQTSSCAGSGSKA